MSLRTLLRGVFLSLVTLLPSAVRANDGAASLAAGGIQLRQERRVSMQKERLRIVNGKGSGFSVTVEYEFLNESAEPVTTEIAFPLPRYDSSIYGAPMPRPDPSFRVWVDGKRIRPVKRIQAFAKGKDVAPTLRALGVDVESHGGGFEPSEGSPQLRALSKSKRAKLAKVGAIGSEAGEGVPGGWPNWEVATTWHWKQVFPPGKLVRVKHEYVPAVGYSVVTNVRGFLSDGYDLWPKSEQGACFEEASLNAMERRLKTLVEKSRGAASMFGFWVDYILTTANTWKTPIRDFELIVEMPEDSFASFCWPGKVERVGKTQLRVRERDFVPKQELKVVFLSFD